MGIEGSGMNKITALVFAALLSLAAVGSATAHELEGDLGTQAAPLAFAQAGASMQSRSFRSCMRQTYGRNYFRGVPRAHRYFMAQACGV
jgi:hypothetical protein